MFIWCNLIGNLLESFLDLFASRTYVFCRLEILHIRYRYRCVSTHFSRWMLVDVVVSKIRLKGLQPIDAIEHHTSPYCVINSNFMVYCLILYLARYLSNYTHITAWWYLYLLGILPEHCVSIEVHVGAFRAVTHLVSIAFRPDNIRPDWQTASTFVLLCAKTNLSFHGDSTTRSGLQSAAGVN